MYEVLKKWEGKEIWEKIVKERLGWGREKGERKRERRKQKCMHPELD